MNLFNFRFSITRKINLRKLLKLNVLSFSLVLLGLIFSIQAQAQPGSVVDYTAPTEFKGLIPSFTVPITFDDHGFGIVSFQFNILYDPTIMTPTGPNFGCSATGTIPGSVGTSFFCNVVPGDEGRLRLSSLGAFTFTTGPDGSGPGLLVNLTFKSTPTAVQGNFSPLTFENDFFFNNLGQLATQNPTNGQITFVGPTAASTILTGRVLTSSGRGLNNSVLTLIDSEGNRRVTLTNSFGYYRFEVVAGETYILGVSAKGRTFIDPERVINVLDKLDEINFVALE